MAKLPAEPFYLIYQTSARHMNGASWFNENFFTEDEVIDEIYYGMDQCDVSYVLKIDLTKNHSEIVTNAIAAKVADKYIMNKKYPVKETIDWLYANGVDATELE